jgi:uracil-DNA glycosylase
VSNEYWETVETHSEIDRRLVLEPDCDRCPALVASRTCISWGNGSTDADVMVVGEAPAAGEGRAVEGEVSDGDEGGRVSDWAGGNYTGCAYTSRHSGRRIRELFADLGYDDRTYYTNAVKCFPAEGVTADGDGTVRGRENLDGDSPTNREPSDAERTNCRSHLLGELEIVDPTVVVATGKHATESLLTAEGRRLDGFLDSVCELFDCPTLGVTLLPILHPSYQEVWLSRLGLSEAAYREEIAAVLPE